MTDKDVKMVRVAEATLKLIAAEGLGSVSPSRIARTAKVSRAWIYKYFGSSRLELVRFAAEHFGRVFASLDRPEIDLTSEAYLRAVDEGMPMLLKMAEDYPWIVSLYFTYRGTENPIGEAIVRVESLYIAKSAREIGRCLGAAPARARELAEDRILLDISIAHRWVTLPKASRPAHRKRLTQMTSAWFRGAIQKG